MKLTGLFKRGAACLCTAAILMGGVSAFALTPALPDEPAPAELSVTNAVSEAQLRSALSKLTVTYDSEAEGWQIDSPYEEASMEKASCGLYPYLFVTNDDPTAVSYTHLDVYKRQPSYHLPCLPRKGQEKR